MPADAHVQQRTEAPRGHGACSHAHTLLLTCSKHAAQLMTRMANRKMECVQKGTKGGDSRIKGEERDSSSEVCIYVYYD